MLAEWEQASINTIPQPTVTGGHPPHDNHTGYFSASLLLHDFLCFFFGASCIYFFRPATVLTKFTHLFDEPKAMYSVQGITCLLFFCVFLPHAVNLPLILSGCLLFSLNVSFSFIVLVIHLLFYFPSILLCHSFFFNSHSSSLLAACIAISFSCHPCSFILCNISITSSLSPTESHIPSFSYCQWMSAIFWYGWQLSFYSIYSMMFLRKYKTRYFREPPNFPK